MTDLELYTYLHLVLPPIQLRIMENYYTVFPFLIYLLRQAKSTLRQPKMITKHRDPLFVLTKSHFAREQTVLLHYMQKHQLEDPRQEYNRLELQLKIKGVCGTNL